MKKTQNLIKNKDLINIFKKSKIKNYINKKHMANFSYLLIKFKKNIRITKVLMFFVKFFLQKYFLYKTNKQKKIFNFIKFSIFLL